MTSTSELGRSFRNLGVTSCRISWEKGRAHVELEAVGGYMTDGFGDLFDEAMDRAIAALANHRYVAFQEMAK